MTTQIPTTAAMTANIPPGPSSSAVDHRSLHTRSQTAEPATKIPDQQIAEVFEKHGSLFMPCFFPVPLTLAENDVLCPVLARLPVSAGLGPLTMTYFHLGIVPLVTGLPTRVTPEQICTSPASRPTQDSAWRRCGTNCAPSSTASAGSSGNWKASMMRRPIGSPSD